MSRHFGYRVMKRLMRQQGDPISSALSGSPSTDPSVAAFVEQLQVAAGREESVQASLPMDAIIDAVTSGSNPAYGDLQPAGHRNSLRRRFVRLATTAGLATKLLFGAAAVAAVTTTVAATGALPDSIQDFVADSVDNVGIEIPRGHAERADELPVPTSPVPAGPIEHRDAVQLHNRCVQDARTGYIVAHGDASGFDAEAVCGDRPDPKDFDKPNAPGQSDNPSETRPPVTGENPSDTRPTPPGNQGGGNPNG